MLMKRLPAHERAFIAVTDGQNLCTRLEDPKRQNEGLRIKLFGYLDAIDGEA